MGMIKDIPEELWNHFAYDADTGDIVCIEGYPGFKEGEVVRSVGARGYYRIGYKGRRYYAHRLAWYLHTGQQPPPIIDHVNGDGLDNRWANLREVTHEQNLRNRAASRASSTGVKGLFEHRQSGGWDCRVRAGKVYRRKYFAPGKRAEAEAWLRETQAELHNEYGRCG